MLQQDLAGCVNFILLALLSLALGANGEAPATRAWVATALVCVSRAELGSYLLYRVSAIRSPREISDRATKSTHIILGSTYIVILIQIILRL